MQVDVAHKYYFRAQTSLNLCYTHQFFREMVTKLPSRFLWKAARKADSTSAVGDLLLIIVPRVESGKTAKRAECPARVACTRKALTREPCPRSVYKIATDIDGCEIGP